MPRFPCRRTAPSTPPCSAIWVSSRTDRVALSPLAPARFPDLPRIEGVRFAAAQAGVRYRDRTDVMLVDLAPGTAVAGVFTTSATRSAPVLDCQSKLGGASPGPAAILVN